MQDADQNNHFNFIKMHLLTYFVGKIRMWATKIGELSPKDIIKICSGLSEVAINLFDTGYQSSNHIDTNKQIHNHDS